ncbi:nudix hydrolase 2-like isoform X3 [Cicer arietinum]|uniref:nudix hydrolase 2-like isoform X3 n=1 Tax=Cicer arietinum TaxID=3827 RepID=UPI003CC62E35
MILKSLPKLSLVFSSINNSRYLANATQRFISSRRTTTIITTPTSRVVKIRVKTPVPIRSMSTSPILPQTASEITAEDQVQQVKLLTSTDDHYGGVIVELDQPMDSTTFVSILRASIIHWKQLEGFWYHHAEPKYLMLVYWIPESPNTIPPNATHRVGIGSFVMNEKHEVLVVRENSGLFQGTGVWKFPTGVVDQGEDIYVAAVREVKEETGVDSEFLEVLAFRQSHNSFFEKSDLFFLCMLRPLSSDIQMQNSEIEDAQWMPFVEYAAQPFIQKSDILKYMNDICLAKIDGRYSGYAPISTSSNFSEQQYYLYVNAGDLKRSNS